MKWRTSSEDSHRPDRMKSHKDNSDTLATCAHCLNRDHKMCNGWSVKRAGIKCLCSNLLNHQD
jgi:hypothetical protein